MDNDWDLYAVVKACAAFKKPYSSSTTTTTTTTSVNIINVAPPTQDPSFTSSSLGFSYDHFSAGFSHERSDHESFQGTLEELCKEFLIHQPPPSAATSGFTPIPATAGASFPVGPVFQNAPPQEISPVQPQTMDIHRQANLQVEYPKYGSSLSFQTANPQPFQPTRRRKNQQLKLVREMTQDELFTTDPWGWRKYGQKPIKGSPYPRNYYRCSTSKGCGARKHVEKSPTNPDIFLVSYSGDHTHPQPTQRNSLAGSTRTKNSLAKASSSNPVISLPKSSSSSSSLGSESSLSPNTSVKEVGNPAQNKDVEMVQEAGNDEEDGDILVENQFMSEEIFRGFQELGWTNNGYDQYNSSGGGMFSSGGLLSPP